jgi:hypothetical protein
MINENGFLMIEPKKKGRTVIIDDITMKVTAILRKAKEVAHYKGSHTCICGAKSGSADLVVKVCGRRLGTNSLAVHYVACHRNEIPRVQLRMIVESRYSYRENPTMQELVGG